MRALTPAGMPQLMARNTPPRYAACMPRPDTAAQRALVRLIGGAEGKGTLVWENKVEFRGQDATGATNDSTTSTDFGPWGGSVAFTPDAEWHFGSEAPPPDRLDFRSAAIHELGHILGLGTSPSWERLVSTNASTFVIAGLLGGTAGAMTGAAIGVLSPLLTLPLTVKGLVVTVIGGLGSIPGAILAGLVVGGVENFFQFIRGVSERDIYVMLMLFVFLVFRPGGLFAAPGGRD